MYDIHRYLHYFHNCPHEFLNESFFSKSDDGIRTDALLLDVLRSIDSQLDPMTELRPLTTFSHLSASHLKAMQLAAWFLSFEKFKNSGALLAPIEKFIFEDLKVLAELVKPEEWLDDEDRGEEFVRKTLFACNLQPDGESEDEALDRLDSLDTLKRMNVLSESREAFNRILEIRRKMAEDRAREAASVYGRE